MRGLTSVFLAGIVIIVIVASAAIYGSFTGLISFPSPKEGSEQVPQTAEISEAPYSTGRPLPASSPAPLPTGSGQPESAESGTQPSVTGGITGGGGSGGEGSAPAPCSDECSEGEKQCSGDYLQSCGNYDSDSCLEWPRDTSGDELCPEGCANGKCITTTYVFVSPGNVSARGGEDFTVDVKIDTEIDIFASDVNIKFDRNVLNATSASEGNFLKKDGASTYPVIEINETSGTVSYASTRFGVQTGVDGEGTLVSIAFDALDLGSCELELAVVLSDTGMNPVPAISVAAGAVDVV